jgi:predicted nuclease with TOPRIM domain
MREYEMSMEQQIKLLVKKVDSLDKRFDAVDEKFDAMDKKFTSKFDAMDQRFDMMDQKFDVIDQKFDAIDHKFDTMGQKFGALENKVEVLDRNNTSKFAQIMVRLDETHAVAKLGLEGLEGLRESTDAKFEAAAKNSADQMGLLKSVLVHVRQRVDATDRPGARRRKS